MTYSETDELNASLGRLLELLKKGSEEKKEVLGEFTGRGRNAEQVQRKGVTTKSDEESRREATQPGKNQSSHQGREGSR